MPKQADNEIAKIEKTQQQLRESIQRTKDLAEETDKLLKQHKKTLKDDQSA